MEKKPLIIFDCFGVICSNITYEFNKTVFDEKTINTVVKDVFAEGDIGAISDDELYLRLSMLCGKPASEIKNFYYEKVVLNKDLIKIIKKLKEKNYVALASNCFPKFIYDVIEKFEIKDLFDEIVVSADQHKVKPNKDFFDEVLNRFKGKISEAYFFDDTQKNVDGAKKAGIKNSFRFINNDTVSEFFNKDFSQNSK